MSQRQLLLAAFWAVIGGLVLTMGPKAFNHAKSYAERMAARVDPMQRQTSRSALVQRALQVGKEIYVAHQTPSELGGIDLGTSHLTDEEAAEAAGLDSQGRFGSGIPAPKAGKSATCNVDVRPSATAYVDCGSEETSDGYPAGLVVKVKVEPRADKPVSVVATNAETHTNN